MINKLKITTLVDNNALPGSSLWAEHGLSFLINADDEMILFDTGQSSEVIAHNLDNLNLDLNDLKHVVLSHGHYDHTGGLKKIAERAKNATIFAHPDAFDEKYVMKEEFYKPIGLPFKKNKLKKTFAFHIDEHPKEIIDGITVTGEISRATCFEQVPEMYRIKENEDYVKDNILDDQALILETIKGLIVILGCAHSGVINTLNYINTIMNRKEIYGVLGGIHLRGAKKSRLQQTAWVLKKYKVKTIGLSHCSGETAFLYFSSFLGDRVFLTSVGSVMQF